MSTVLVHRDVLIGFIKLQGNLRGNDYQDEYKILKKSERRMVAALEDESFASPDRREPNAPFDPWPALNPRLVHVRFARYEVGVSYVRAAPALIVLPISMAKARFPDLVQIDATLAPIRLTAWRRRSLTVSLDKATVVLDALISSIG